MMSHHHPAEGIQTHRTIFRERLLKLLQCRKVQQGVRDRFCFSICKLCLRTSGTTKERACPAVIQKSTKWPCVKKYFSPPVLIGNSYTEIPRLLLYTLKKKTYPCILSIIHIKCNIQNINPSAELWFTNKMNIRSKEKGLAEDAKG